MRSAELSRKPKKDKWGGETGLDTRVALEKIFFLNYISLFGYLRGGSAE